jgi:hypothetical protein
MLNGRVTERGRSVLAVSCEQTMLRRGKPGGAVRLSLPGHTFSFLCFRVPIKPRQNLTFARFFGQRLDE